MTKEQQRNDEGYERDNNKNKEMKKRIEGVSDLLIKECSWNNTQPQICNTLYRINEKYTNKYTRPDYFNLFCDINRAVSCYLNVTDRITDSVNELSPIDPLRIAHAIHYKILNFIENNHATRSHIMPEIEQTIEKLQLGYKLNDSETYQTLSTINDSYGFIYSDAECYGLFTYIQDVVDYYLDNEEYSDSDTITELSYIDPLRLVYSIHYKLLDFLYKIETR